MALKPLHGISVLLGGTRLAQLRDLLVKAYWACERPNEQQLVRALGVAYFGVDMLYDSLPAVWPNDYRREA